MLRTSCRFLCRGTVDAEEVHKFQALRKLWWDRAGPFGPLHDMNPCRMEYIRSMSELRGKRVLDVGCGGGILSTSLCRAGCHVTGLDATEGSIAAARDHQALYPELSSIEFIHSSIEEHAATLAREGAAVGYDIVVLSEVLEHVSDLETFVAAAVKCLAEGGAFIATTINKTLLSRVVMKYFAEAVGLVPYGTHEYEKFVEPSRLSELCTRNGLHVMDVQGVVVLPHVFPAPRLSFHMCPKRTEINYFLAAVKLPPV